MQSFYVCFLMLIFVVTGQAQTSIKVNSRGQCIDTTIQELIKTRNYQLVSSFDTISNHPMVVFAIYMKGGKMGILDLNGREVTQAVYTAIPGLKAWYPNEFSLKQKLIIVEQDQKYGLIDFNGKTVIEFDYKSIKVTNFNYLKYTFPQQDISALKAKENEELFEAEKDGQSLIIDSDGKVHYLNIPNISIPEVTEVMDWEFSTEKRAPRKQNRFGNVSQTYHNGDHMLYKRSENGLLLRGIYSARTDTLSIPIEYLNIQSISGGRYILTNTNKRTGIVDSLGKVLVDFNYSSVRRLGGEKYAFTKDGALAIYSKNFEPITGFEYEISNPSGAHNLYALTKHNKLGLVNSYNGKELTAFKYDKIRFVNDCKNENKPLIIVSINGEIGLLDSMGQEILALKHDLLVPECKVTSNNPKLDMPYNVRSNTENKFFVYSIAGNYGIYDTNLNIISDGYSGVVKSNYHNMIYVAKTIDNAKRWGVYSPIQRKMILPITFDYPIKYTNGGFKVKKNRLYGLIDSSGKEIIPVKQPVDFYVFDPFPGLYLIKYRLNSSEIHQYFIDANGNSTK